MSWAVQIENVSKRYRLGSYVGGYSTLRDTLAKLGHRSWRQLFGRRCRNANNDDGTLAVRELWALRDVSFAIQQGESVGIIGRNGAGKSTLLKILSRITHPTSGTIRFRGKVGSLLEVGAGFHHELTGRENIYLNAAILGMSAKEVARRLDEIVAFAGVERFLDTPVKRYSSGMYVRLAFAVAAHLEPDILVVDEVLAVGDQEFQQKCVGKMQDSMGQGRTVIFVSHNLPVVNALTQRCAYLERGELRVFGPTSQVISQYVADLSRNRQVFHTDLTPFRRNGLDGSVLFQSVRLTNNDGQMDHLPMIDSGQEIALDLELECTMERAVGYLILHLSREGQQTATTVFSGDYAAAFQFKKGSNRLRCTLPAVPWAPGTYLGTFRVARGPTVAPWDMLVDLPLFEIVLPKAARQEMLYLERSWGVVHLEDVCWEHFG